MAPVRLRGLRSPARQLLRCSQPRLAASRGCKRGGLALQVMYRATYTPDGGWQGGLEPYGPLQLLPSAQARSGPRRSWTAAETAHPGLRSGRRRVCLTAQAPGAGAALILPSPGAPGAELRPERVRGHEGAAQRARPHRALPAAGECGAHARRWVVPDEPCCVVRHCHAACGRTAESNAWCGCSLWGPGCAPGGGARPVAVLFAEPGEPAPVGRRNELYGARRRGAAEHAAAVG